TSATCAATAVRKDLCRFGAIIPDAKNGVSMGRVGRQLGADACLDRTRGNVDRWLASGSANGVNNVRNCAIRSPQLDQRLIGEADRALAMIGRSGGDSMLRSGGPRWYDGVNRPRSLWNGSRPPRSRQYVTARAYWSVRSLSCPRYTSGPAKSSVPARACGSRAAVIGVDRPKSASFTRFPHKRMLLGLMSPCWNATRRPSWTCW